MKHKKLGPFTYLDSIQIACPEEFDDASKLPEEMVRALYPHACLGPAFPQIIQMHKELHFVNAVAIEESAANAILKTLLKAVDYTRVSPNNYDPISVLSAYARKHEHLRFSTEWREVAWAEFQNGLELANAFTAAAPYGSGAARITSLSITLSAALTIFVLNSKPSKTAAAEHALRPWNKCVNDIKELRIPQ